MPAKKAVTKKAAASRRRPIRARLRDVAVSDKAARTGRTGLQGGAAGVLLKGVELFTPISLSTDQTLWLMAVLTPVLALLQGVVEEWLGKAILRSVPPRDEPTPVVDAA